VSLAFETHDRDNTMKLYEGFKILTELSDIELDKLFIKSGIRSSCLFNKQLLAMIEQNPGIKDSSRYTKALKTISKNLHDLYPLVQQMDSVNDRSYIEYVYQRWQANVTLLCTISDELP
jgi:hypothetical protein